MNRIIHFEIQADNPERAAKFYREALGWDIKKWEGPGVAMEYWMVMTGPEGSKEPGINGGILKRPCPAPKPEQGTNAYVCTAIVEDIDKAAEAIEKAGGKLAMEKFMIADMAWQAYYIDTEGNTFGIHQPVKKMK
jgi:uncharacterized protein